MGKLYQKFFAAIYDPFMGQFEKKLSKKRKGLISDLEGKILEVGAGTGINFQFYGKNTEVIAVEPSADMAKRARLKVPDGSNITIMEHGVNAQAVIDVIPNESLDAVVSTLVLCTVPNVELAIENFSKWLKPSGKLILIEHIRPKTSLKGKVFDFINPAWKVVGDGCNLNRNTDQLIKSAGFVPTYEKYYDMGLPWYEGVFTKKVLVNSI